MTRLDHDTTPPDRILYRIQPPDIDVPRDEPFKNDLLGRRPSIEVLTHLVGSLEGPCVLAVDAPWGTGKSTFFRMWRRYLKNQAFGVAHFNAWETDFAGDPLLALSTQILDSLDSEGDRTQAALKKLKDGVPDLLRAVAPSVIRVATSGVLDVEALLEPAERVRQYQEAVKLFGTFRADLQDAARTVSESRDGRPLVVMIDELDRCRPPYAIELLEVAKHIFAARHIVFALAVNRSELEHSVKALYGDGFDAHGYLRRFVDIDFRLPDPDREPFIEAMLDATGINDFLAQATDHDTRQYATLAKEMLHGFFALPRLSIRAVAQAIHRLGLIFASLAANYKPLLLPATTALILRTLDLELYRRFTGRGIAVDEVVRRLSGGPDGTLFQELERRYVFEAMLIIAADEQGRAILQEYATLASDDKPDDIAEQAAWKHADATVRLVQAKIGWEGWRGEFEAAVERMELFAESLK